MIEERVITSCERFEELLDKDELTDEEFTFCIRHQQDCPLRIHTDEVLERQHGLPPGSLKNWNGLDPLPPSLPAAKEQYAKRLLDRVLDTSADSILVKGPTPTVWIPRSNQTEGAVIASRRSFLVGMTRAAAAALLVAIEASWLAEGVFAKYQEYLRVGNRRPERLELLSHLLKPNGEIAYSAAQFHQGLREGPLAAHWQQKRGFPHDRAAIAAFRNLDPVTPIPKPGDGEEALVQPAQNLIVAGSPVSSEEARLHLPYCDLASDPDAVISNTYRPDKIPYRFVIGNEERIVVRSGMLGGTESRKRAHGIQAGSTGRIWQPRQYVDLENRLKTDFLIVSRLPRNPGGGDIVLITGAHGPGVEGFALLFDDKAFPDSQLKELFAVLESARYFQFVLECSDISDDEGMSKARKLSISEDCPPQAITFSADMFNEDVLGLERQT